jgi:hypothetical protein
MMTYRHGLDLAVVITAALTTFGCEVSRRSLSPSSVPALTGAATVVKGPFGAERLHGSPQRITLCHLGDDEDYVLLSIGGSAEPAHRAHGDAEPGARVPGMDGFVFDSHCGVVPTAAAVVTGGQWQIVHPGVSPNSLFTMTGPAFAASGRWYFPTQPAPCLNCVPGQTVSLAVTFDNPSPVGLPSIASGSATVAGVVYDDVEFRGPLRFDTALVTIPPAPPEPLQLVTVTTPFVLSGRLQGYDVLNTREPLLAFDVGVTGRGTARLEMFTGAANSTVMTFYRLTYEFSN